MKLKNAALSGITPRKIMVRACIVKSWLNTDALTTLLSARISCVRMIMASKPPIRKNVKAVTRYSTPMRLWSTVVIQAQTPVGLVGRRSTAAMVAIGLLRVADRQLCLAEDSAGA